MNIPDMSNVDRARAAIEGHATRTPVVPSPTLSRMTGLDVYLKCEQRQVTGSFKVRGALAAISAHELAGHSGAVTTCSAGNHGKGLAYAARLAGLDCHVVVPKKAPEVKTRAIAELGASLIRTSFDSYDESLAWTMNHLDDIGGSFISAYDDADVIAGNGGSTACEICEDAPPMDAMIIPCGGGGCAAGAGLVTRSLAPATKIIAVNPEASPAMWMSRQDNRPHLTVDSRPTIADGLEGGIGELPYAMSQTTIDDVWLVTEEAIERAVALIFHHEGMILEGAGAAGVAAVLSHPLPGKRICIWLTGGNIEPSLHRELLSVPSPSEPRP
ncbi:MAG: threonine ammonia-lyase [Planctomycetota bacterium]|jgi:threonine dehydratase